MIYKLIVNAAFLAIGYYIGKQVGFNEAVGKKSAESGEPSSLFSEKVSSRSSPENPRADTTSEKK